MGLAAILLASAAPEHAIDGPPALWPWRDNDTLIEYQLEQLAEAGVHDIEVVLGYGAERVVPLLARDGVEAIIDANWRSGEASSLRVGAAAVPRGTDTAIIVRVEEPRPASIIRSLLDVHAHGGAAITRAVHEGRPGTPIIVGGSTVSELRNLRDGDSLSALCDRHGREIQRVELHSVVRQRLTTYTDGEEMQEMADL